MPDNRFSHSGKTLHINAKQVTGIRRFLLFALIYTTDTVIFPFSGSFGLLYFCIVQMKLKNLQQ